MTPTPEFIVLDESFGCPMSLTLKSGIWHGLPEGGILRRGMSGAPVTVIASRTLASEAVKRTHDYDAKRNADAPEIELSISRLERRAV